jgi:hypothetical protein
MLYRSMAWVRPVVVGLAAAWLAGCSPTLDWRDVRPADSGVALLLPCRPTPQVRSVRLAGRTVNLALYACSAGEQTWALAFADLADPALVGPALQELQASAAANVGASTAQSLTLAVPGATPHPDSRRSLLSGRLPDGRSVQEQVAVFAVGTLVFQATVLGPSLPSEGVETFFSSLRAGR